MFRCLLWAIAAAVRPKALLIADNLCLRQQLLVLHRRKPRPRLEDADRRFWVLGWRTSVLIVKPETVLRWHRRGWRTYWCRRSSRKGKPGRRPIAPELGTLIRRMTIENPLWGQRRIQAELARLGFKVSARTVAKYMHRGRHRGPSSRWRSFLRQHASTVWACDFFCVQTITFRTLYVFFVIHHASRQVLHVHVTAHPTAKWTAQQAPMRHEQTLECRSVAVTGLVEERCDAPGVCCGRCHCTSIGMSGAPLATLVRRSPWRHPYGGGNAQAESRHRCRHEREQAPHRRV